MPTKEELERTFRYDARTGQLFNRGGSNQRRKNREAGFMMNTGYRHVKFGRTRMSAHRIVWIMHNGPIPPGTEIDHINHVKNDNRIENLRAVSHRINMRNVKLRRSSHSGVAGVSWHTKDKGWVARVSMMDGTEFNLGTFDKFRDAVIARKTAERLLAYHENHGRDAIMKAA